MSTHFCRVGNKTPKLENQINIDELKEKTVVYIEVDNGVNPTESYDAAS